MIKGEYSIDVAYKHWNYSYRGYVVMCPKFYAGHMATDHHEVTCPLCKKDIAAYIAMKMETAK